MKSISVSTSFALAMVFSVNATAETIEWTGAVVNSCVMTIGNHGTLGVAIDGKVMSSDNSTGGIPASVAVMSTGPNQLSISAPTLTLQAVTYTGSPEMSSKYSSNKGHAATWQQTSHEVVIGSGNVIFDVHARMTETEVFPMGAYKLSSEVTCAPAN
ncbi:MAG: hypothetical protein K9J28_09120 [Sulfuritalea sp.]|nr:hypothetical protein [Sulfuritalea sp.]